MPLDQAPMRKRRRVCTDLPTRFLSSDEAKEFVKSGGDGRLAAFATGKSRANAVQERARTDAVLLFRSLVPFVGDTHLPSFVALLGETAHVSSARKAQAVQLLCDAQFPARACGFVDRIVFELQRNEDVEFQLDMLKLAQIFLESVRPDHPEAQPLMSALLSLVELSLRRSRSLVLAILTALRARVMFLPGLDAARQFYRLVEHGDAELVRRALPLMRKTQFTQLLTGVAGSLVKLVELVPGELFPLMEFVSCDIDAMIPRVQELLPSLFSPNCFIRALVSEVVGHVALARISDPILPVWTRYVSQRLDNIESVFLLHKLAVTDAFTAIDYENVLSKLDRTLCPIATPKLEAVLRRASRVPKVAAWLVRQGFVNLT